MTQPFGVGFCLPQLGGGIDAAMVRDVAQAAEEVGFASLWVQEHLFAPISPSTGYSGRDGVPVPEQYRSTLSPLELLSAVAMCTSGTLLGTSVLVGGYHRPVELAQRLATLDVLSEGRLVVGLGVGWSVDEHRQMDVPTARRGVRLEELVRALRACWADDPVAFTGEFFTIPPSRLRPKPVQAHVPIIGGARTDAGCRRVVRSFDGWNPAGLPVDVAVERWHELQATRSPDLEPLSLWLRTFVQHPNAPQPRPLDDVIAEVHAAAATGMRQVIIDANFSDPANAPGGWLGVVERLGVAVAQSPSP